MERTKIVAGNWKLNGSISLTQEFIDKLTHTTNSVDVVVCPPYPYIGSFGNVSFSLGAQNVAAYQSGAFTGEVSAAMLVECGVKYVIIGHSERREHFADTNDVVSTKIQCALSHGLIPIVCVGEPLAVREQGNYAEFVIAQLDAIINSHGVAVFDNVVIAYEPIWAIGTGKTASPEQAQEVHALIRQHIASMAPDTANALRILYGGSVNSGNAKALFAQPDIDGGLVGGASLKIDEFNTICNAAN